MTSDISNRELKETLVSMKESFRESNNSLKEFITQTNVNITQLNDNLVTHTLANQQNQSANLSNIAELTKEISKLTIFLDKYGSKIFWFIMILIGIILAMAGYDFLVDKIGITL